MKQVLAALALISMSATGAYADSKMDLAPKRVVSPPPVVATYNWTGAYAGLGLGYLRQSDTQFSPTRILAPARGAELSVLLGYNFQGATPLVFGGEIMLAAGSVKGDEPCANPAYTCASEVKTTAALRGRVGFAQDRTLFFMTAGVAKMSVTHSTDNSPALPGLTSVSDNRTALTLGLGVEHAMMNGWNIRGDVEGYRLRGGNYTLDAGLNYSPPRGTAIAARVTMVRRF